MTVTAEKRAENRVLLDLAANFDVEELRAKYISERDKRIRKEGIGQYIEVDGDYRHYVDDPYVDPGFEREAVTADLDVVIIGGGFGGMLAAVRLLQAGFQNIKIVEKAGDFGGTWYWNRYPGAQCDTDSNIYLPLLEETGYVAPVIRVGWAGIYEHSRRIAETFGLYDRALLQTTVTGQTWLEDEDRWELTTDRGDRLKARYVVAASGALQRPKLPGIPGLNKFKGASFHTSRWDYEYTGGDSSGNLKGLADKRVAIVGTGCTAIQCIPHLAAAAKKLYVVQRTPITITTLKITPIEESWQRSLAPGWQRQRNEDFVTGGQGGMFGSLLNKVDDSWTRAFAGLNPVPQGMSPGDFEPTDLEFAQELADFRLMNQIRQHVEDIVKDKETAEALKPWYGFRCKRPGFVDEYLEAFNQPNVTLLDTAGQGAEGATESGILVNGVEYPVDCIIFATGFEVGTSYLQRIGYDVRGRNGLLLSDYWSNGPRTLHGLYSNGFPNFFHMGPVQGGISTNIPHLLDEQARHIAEIVQVLRSRRARTFEPTAASEDAWIKTIEERGQEGRKYFQECTPGYYNTEGQTNRHGLIDNVFFGGPLEFFKLIESWRRTGEFEGVEIAYA